MKIVLIFPRVAEYQAGQAPLGLASLAGYLRKNGYKDIKILDFSFHKSLDQAYKEIKKIKADLVGISAMSYLMEPSLKIASIIKQNNPNIIIAFGGPHATMYPEDVARENNVDIVAYGEAEKTFLNLIQHIEQEKSLKEVRGIAYKTPEGQVVKNPPAELIKDLDEIGMPARDMIPTFKKYISLVPFFPLEFPMTTMVTSRGCPYSCTFCQPTLEKLFGKIPRTRSAKNIVDEMEYLQNHYKIKSIFFSDSLFTYKRSRTMDICKEIVDRKLDITWECQSRVNTIDKELVVWMKKANCKVLSFGVESGSQRILDFAGKGTTKSQISNAFKICREVGIVASCNYMIGFPTETKEDLKMSLQQMLETKPDLLNVYITSPVPGTAMYDAAKGMNLIKTEDLNIIGRRNDADGMFSKFKSDELDDKYLENFQQRFIREYARMLLKEGAKLNKKSLMKVVFDRYWGIAARKSPIEAVKDFNNIFLSGITGKIRRYATKIKEDQEEQEKAEEILAKR